MRLALAMPLLYTLYGSRDSFPCEGGVRKTKTGGFRKTKTGGGFEKLKPGGGV